MVEDQRIRRRIQAALKGNVKRGEGQRSFREVVDAEFDKAGLTRLKSYQIENIYVTNTSLAYGSGQMSKLLEVSGDFPFWKFSATMDSRTRPDHAALHGKIFRTGDFTFYPPLGFRCRCTAIPLTASQAGRYLKSDMPDGKQKEALYASLTSKEFVGNKQQKYLEWAAKQYEEADADARRLMDEAFDRMKAQIKAVRKPGGQEDDEALIPVELRSESEYFKGTGIRLKRKFFELIDQKAPIGLTIDKEGKGSYYSPAQRTVHIASNERTRKSKWNKERVIYHEFGHGIDWQRDLRSTKKITALMRNWKKELAKEKDYTIFYAGRSFKLVMPQIQYVSEHLNDLYRRINRMEEATFVRRGISKADVQEQILATQDTIMALNPNYGWGHTKAYYRQSGKRPAEFIAHCFENRFASNVVFKKYLPELYADMIRFVDELE